MNDKHGSILENAIQFHNEFPMECAFFVEFIEIKGNAVLTNLEYNSKTWAEQPLPWSFDVWLRFVTQITSRIKDYKLLLKQDASIFAKLLFGDINRMFTLHCLYVLHMGIPEHQRLNNRINVLFFSI